MAEESKERPDSAAGPVFVDSSGGRRRRWRRLGLALGAVGGGYALIVAVSVIGGNSEAPWGVLIPGGDDGAARVVPDRDGSQTQAPWADGAHLGEPDAYASPESSEPRGNGARPPRISPETSPPAAAPSGAAAPGAKGSGSGKTGSGKADEGATSAGSGSAGGTGGTGSAGGPGTADPSTDPAGGGTTGSTGSPTSPPPSESPESSSGDGFLDGILAGLAGAPGSTTAAGAE